MDLQGKSKSELIAIIEIDRDVVKRARRALADVVSAHKQANQLRADLEADRKALARLRGERESMAEELCRAQQAARKTARIITKEVVAYRMPPDYHATKERLTELEARLARDL